MSDLGVILDKELSLWNYIGATIAKGLSMLGFVKRLSSEFRDPYTLFRLYVHDWNMFAVFGSHSTLFTLQELSGFKKSSLNTRNVGLDGMPVLVCRLIAVVAC
jgi:hypothetical protein